jgi:hypothetical protein
MDSEKKGYYLGNKGNILLSEQSLEDELFTLVAVDPSVDLIERNRDLNVKSNFCGRDLFFLVVLALAKLAF